MTFQPPLCARPLRASPPALYTPSVGEQNGHPARCVVWTPAGTSVPTDLAGVLERRGLQPVHAPSPHLALAEICRSERAKVRSALILVGIEDPARVLAAVERFAPSAVVWLFAPGANPPLRPVVSSLRPQISAKARDQQSPVPAETLEAALTPRNGAVQTNGAKPDNGLKLVTPPADPIRQGPPVVSRTVSARDILDDAELEMLLAGEKAMEDRSR